MAPCALVFDFQDIASAPSNHPWLSATATALLFLFAYVLMRQRHYRLLCNRARECPHVASITVMGGISEELQSRQVELMLRGELAAIADAYRNFSKLQTDVASTDVLMDAPGFELDLHGTIKFGGVEIPLPVITNLLRVPILHLRSRLEYLGLLIHVSLVSVGEHTQVLVYREGRNVPRPLPANGSATAPRPTALEKTAQITNVSAVPGLIRDTAFMILQLHGTVDRNRQLVSVRHFTEGLKALKAHALIDHPELQTRAKQEFHLAVHEDPHYYEALYFYATLTLEERTEDSINSAITLFRRALEATLMGQNTSAPILGVDQVNVQKRRKDQHCKRLGFANAGLAHCYFQQAHRLESGSDAARNARQHAEEAGKQWAAADQDPHSWILYVQAIAGIIDHPRAEPPADKNKRFATVADQLRRAIEIDENNSSPKNWRYYNTLGWSMLQVAESSVPSLDGIEVPGGPSRSAAEIAQQYFEESLQLDPDNKLSHANLCRLHATRDYRSKPEHLEKCRDHGLKAITIDPKYVEGYGDFAVSLVRHKKFDEAHRYYLRARDLAEKTPAKQKRIRKDALEALNEIGAGAGESQRWH